MSRDQLRELIREVIAEVVEDLELELRHEVGVLHKQPKAHREPEQMIVSHGMLTERLLRTATLQKIEIIKVASEVLVTPLARDAARTKGIRLERIK